MSSPEAKALAIHDTTLSGRDVLGTLGWRRNRVPKSLVKSTGPLSNTCPHTQALTSWCSSFSEEATNISPFIFNKFRTEFMTTYNLQWVDYPVQIKLQWTFNSSYHLFLNNLKLTKQKLDKNIAPELPVMSLLNEKSHISGSVTSSQVCCYTVIQANGCKFYEIFL